MISRWLWISGWFWNNAPFVTLTSWRLHISVHVLALWSLGWDSCVLCHRAGCRLPTRVPGNALWPHRTAFSASAFPCPDGDARLDLLIKALRGNCLWEKASDAFYCIIFMESSLSIFLSFWFLCLDEASFFSVHYYKNIPGFLISFFLLFYIVFWFVGVFFLFFYSIQIALISSLLP